MQTPNRFRKMLVFGGVSLVVILAFLALFSWGAQPADKKIADEFTKAITANKPDQAYALTNGGFKDNTSAAEWKDTVDLLSKVYSATPRPTHKVVNQLNIGEQHKYFYSVQGGGKTYELQVWLLQDTKSKKWQVDYFSSNVTESS